MVKQRFRIESLPAGTGHDPALQVYLKPPGHGVRKAGLRPEHVDTSALGSRLGVMDLKDAVRLSLEDRNAAISAYQSSSDGSRRIRAKWRKSSVASATVVSRRCLTARTRR